MDRPRRPGRTARIDPIAREPHGGCTVQSSPKNRRLRRKGFAVSRHKLGNDRAKTHLDFGHHDVGDCVPF